MFLGISNLNNGRLDLSEVGAHCGSAFHKMDQTGRTENPEDLAFSYETRLGQAALIPEGLRCCLGRRLATAQARIQPRSILASCCIRISVPSFRSFLKRASCTAAPFESTAHYGVSRFRDARSSSCTAAGHRRSARLTRRQNRIEPQDEPHIEGDGLCALRAADEGQPMTIPLSTSR